MIKISAVTKYPQKQQTTEGGKYRPFLNLKNLKTKSTKTFAHTELIQGKSKPLNRPGTVTVSNFKCGLPTGSLVTKITVHYAHAKVAYNGKVCNVGAPTISIIRNGKIDKYGSGKLMSKKGQAPTTSIKSYDMAFTHHWDYTEINSDDFGIRINYPTNSNAHEGYIRLYNFYVTITYKAPSYTLKVKGRAEQPVNNEPYQIDIELTNKNKVKYRPTVTITAPAGVSVDMSRAGNEVTKINNQTWQWTPSKMSGMDAVGIGLFFDINVTFPLGATYYPIRIDAGITTTNTTAYYTTNVLPKPAREDTTSEEDPSGTPTINNQQAEPTRPEIVSIAIEELFDFELDLGDLDKDDYVHLWCCTVTNGQFDNWDINTRSEVIREYQGGVTTFYTFDNLKAKVSQLKYAGCHPAYTYYENGMWITIPPEDSWGLKISERGTYALVITMPDQPEEILKVVYLDVTPGVTVPNATILIPTQEELNRLGDENYIVQSYIEAISDEGYVRDWGKNFKIGVFNNAISDNITVTTITPEDPDEDPYDVVTDSTDYYNLTSHEILKYAEYWSEPFATLNEFHNVECKFHYNKDYPLYIIIAGDYNATGCNKQIKFTEPCIIEEGYYDVRENNGTYPIPIDNTVLSDGSFAELNMQGNSTATPVIYYDLPLEDFENETHAVRGIEVTGTIEQNSDDLNIYAKVITPNGESRARSINLDVNKKENEFSIGGMGDLWGLSTTDITSLEDWEVEFMVDNTLNGYDGSINYSNISVIFYIAEIDQQNYRCYVNGEDISYYGAFLKDVEIPEGLKTDVDYLTIDGTDTNDPYRQNIREKEITIELDIGDNCNLAESTLSVRDLARLFQNKRDKYNRPIPNRIEFSHYPDVYWEYIMEDTFDNKVEISSYEVKIKLTIPSGTAYKKQSTTTNKVGYVNGLASVNPVIVIKPTDNLITVTETLTDQNFHMGYDGDITDKVFVIDCEDRIVWLKQDEDSEDGENITAYVDWNSDWFAISGEYQFEATGAVIKAVDYIERW